MKLQLNGTQIICTSLASLVFVHRAVLCTIVGCRLRRPVRSPAYSSKTLATPNLWTSNKSATETTTVAALAVSLAATKTTDFALTLAVAPAVGQTIYSAIPDASLAASHDAAHVAIHVATHAVIHAAVRVAYHVEPCSSNRVLGHAAVRVVAHVVANVVLLGWLRAVLLAVRCTLVLAAVIAANEVLRRTDSALTIVSK